MVLADKHLTLEEFLKLPERKPALEYEDGEVLQKVSPKHKHATLQGALVRLFNNFAVPRKLAHAAPELRTTFGARSVVPDVALFVWDRIPRDPNGEPADDVFSPPDVAVEIVSPKQSVARLFRRCVWYVENGVRIALLVDNGDRTVFFFRPGAVVRALRGDQAIDLGEVLPGFQLTAKELFDSLRLV